VVEVIMSVDGTEETIVQDTYAPEMAALLVARRHGIPSNQLF
jgi:hypothetical protein